MSDVDSTTIYLLGVFEKITQALRDRVLLGVRDPVDDTLRTELRAALFKINEHLVEISERWACDDRDADAAREFTLTGPTVEDVLERCAKEGMREVTLRRYRVALPTSDMIDVHQFVESINDYMSDGPDEVSFANWDGPLIQASSSALADLEARLTVTVRWWALSHGCHKSLAERDVSIYAWQFYGEPRTFVWDEETPIVVHDEDVDGRVDGEPQGRWRETTDTKEPS